VASQLLEALQRVGQRPRVLILRLREMPFLDATGAGALKDFAAECGRRDIRLIFSGAQPQPLELLTAVGLGRASRAVTHAENYAAALALAERL
jgi:sulfate permease, SulP family